MVYNFYTENLCEFGYLQIEILCDILTAWIDKGLPTTFYLEAVRPAFNKNSENVFLVNGEYQAAMLNGENLEQFHSLPHSGIDGFLTNLIQQNNPSDLHLEDVEYILNEAEIEEIDVQSPWLDVKIDRILSLE